MGKAMEYQAEFLQANRVTREEFEQAYIQFQQANPDLKAYKDFAKRWKMNIISSGGQLPHELEIKLSVYGAALKVLAKTEEEAEQAMRDTTVGIWRQWAKGKGYFQ